MLIVGPNTQYFLNTLCRFLVCWGWFIVNYSLSGLELTPVLPGLYKRTQTVVLDAELPIVSYGSKPQ